METDLSVKISIETYNKIKEINNQIKVPFKWIIDQAINSYILTKKITQKNDVKNDTFLVNICSTCQLYRKSQKTCPVGRYPVKVRDCKYHKPL